MAKNNYKDLTGQKFGRLIVIKDTEKRKNNHVVWLCKCECGNTVEVIGSNLKNKNTQSCGCKAKELFKINRRKPNHNMYKTRQFAIWNSMKQRCLNQNNLNYKHYGGRGIKVCEKWLTFKGFWEDMQEGYSENLTIDRINVNGNYEKNNCRWASIETQANNRRTNIMVTIKGITLSFKQHCKIVGINYSTAMSRVTRHGYTYENAILVPVKTKYCLKR